MSDTPAPRFGTLPAGAGRHPARMDAGRVVAYPDLAAAHVRSAVGLAETMLAAHGTAEAAIRSYLHTLAPPPPDRPAVEQSAADDPAHDIAARATQLGVPVSAEQARAVITALLPP